MNGYNFEHESIVADKFRDVGVLELWFEPVYKPIKLTDSFKMVNFTKDSITTDTNSFTLEDLVQLYELMMNTPNFHGWSVTFPEVNVNGEGFTLSEMKQMIDIHKNLVK